ncbi:hypothetical protein BH20CHL7_BH20CHL7_13740 [soil metagenome]
MVAALIAACGGGPTGTSTPAPPTDPVSPTATIVRAAPSDVASPTMTPIEDPEATDPPPTADPTSPAESAEPEPTDPTGASADACTGTPANHDFYAAVADAVAWTVYCPVLPAGWFVETGQYRLAGGGWLEISYRGPGGARLELREGVFCEGDDCTPDGTDLGAADFGDRSGSLLDLGAGRYAIVVDAGASPSWVVVASGLSEAAVRSAGSAMVVVGGS